MNTKTNAIDAYLARAAAIHIKVAPLRQLADDSYGHNPDATHIPNFLVSALLETIRGSGSNARLHAE